MSSGLISKSLDFPAKQVPHEGLRAIIVNNCSPIFLLLAVHKQGVSLNCWFSLFDDAVWCYNCFLSLAGVGGWAQYFAGGQTQQENIRLYLGQHETKFQYIQRLWVVEISLEVSLPKHILGVQIWLAVAVSRLESPTTHCFNVKFPYAFYSLSIGISSFSCEYSLNIIPISYFFFRSWICGGKLSPNINSQIPSMPAVSNPFRHWITALGGMYILSAISHCWRKVSLGDHTSQLDDLFHKFLSNVTF